MDEHAKKTFAMPQDRAGRPAPDEVVRGVAIHRGWLDAAAQEAMLADIAAVAARAPFFQPETRRGRKMSVRMTSAGRYGWLSDRRGYRYVQAHPVTGAAFPPIPASVLALWRAVTGLDRLPDSCLVNLYLPGARMGLHQDRDEADFAWPVVSVSLGDAALFRVGGETRGGTTQSTWLTSGDVAVMGGRARLVHHGIDRIQPGSAPISAPPIEGGGRINLTLRVVD